MTIKELENALPLNTIIRCYDNTTGELRLISHGSAGIVEGNRNDLTAEVRRILNGNVRLYSAEVEAFCNFNQ